MDQKSQKRFACRCVMKMNSWQAAGKHMAGMAESQQTAKSCWPWCHNDRHFKLSFQSRRNGWNLAPKLWRKWRDEMGRKFSHPFPKFSKLLESMDWEITSIKWKFNYGGFGSDDNPRIPAWFARKLWKQEVIQRHLQSVLPHISDLAVDSASMESA